MRFVKVFMGGGCMERVRRAVAVEVESPPSELYTVEEPYRRVVEEVAVYVAERGRLEVERYKELYRRFRDKYPLPAQLVQQVINQGVEIGKSFLEAKRNGRVQPIVHAVWVLLKALKAGGKWPAVLARAAPMTPARGDRARVPPHGAPAPPGRRSVYDCPVYRLYAEFLGSL